MIFYVLELPSLLPSSLQSFTHEVLKPIAHFELLPSLCSREVREVPPVFIIPGFSGIDNIKKLAKKLYYPTYVAGLPSVATPIKDIAAELAMVSTT